MKIDNEIVSIPAKGLDRAHSPLLKAAASLRAVVALSASLDEIWLGKR
jgi:hypothetical protein